jgi:hypothetical protein
MEPARARSYQQLFSNGLWRLTSFAVYFIVDAAIGSSILGGLLWFAWLIGPGKAWGVSQEHLKALSDAHFWINYGVFVMMGLALFVRALRGIFRDD